MSFVDLTIRSTITQYWPKFAENYCAHKVSRNVLLTSVTILLSPILSLFFGLSNDACYRYVMTNKSIKYILIDGK